MRRADGGPARSPSTMDTIPGLHLERPKWPKIDEVVSCSVCGCAWMEQILVQQYSKDHFVILGQQVPEMRPVGFYLLRCPKCGEVYEPNLQSAPQDTFRKGYDDFLDQMEAPLNDAKDNK